MATAPKATSKDDQKGERRQRFRPIPGSPQERALSSDADIVIFGGAAGGGKTSALVAGAARGKDDPLWTSVIFRRTYPELSQPDGVIDQSKRFYPKPNRNFNASTSEWQFPSGSRVVFSHLQHEDDKRKWAGSALAFIGFDQLEDFEQSQFFYMLRSMRTPPGCGYEPQMFATCNPAGSDHWLYDFLGWWIHDADHDERPGLPIVERAGEKRWFHREGYDINWVEGPYVTNDEGDAPLSVTFIPATVDDNPYIPDSYVRALNAMPPKERQEQRWGRWGVDEDQKPLSAHAIQSVEEMPDDAGVPVRYWDLADTDANSGSAEQASHTAGVRVAGVRRMWTTCLFSDPDNRQTCSYWEQGEADDPVCPRCGHETLDSRQRKVLVVSHATWFQLSGDDKDNRIESVAQTDGPATVQGIEQEGGQSGKDVIERNYRQDVLSDFEVIADKPTGDKRSRMKLWIPLAKSGRLWVVRGPWAQSYKDALENMTPMDVLDATSGAATLALDDDRIDGGTSWSFG